MLVQLKVSENKQLIGEIQFLVCSFMNTFTHLFIHLAR